MRHIHDSEQSVKLSSTHTICARLRERKFETPLTKVAKTTQNILHNQHNVLYHR